MSVSVARLLLVGLAATGAVAFAMSLGSCGGSSVTLSSDVDGGASDGGRSNDGGSTNDGGVASDANSPSCPTSAPSGACNTPQLSCTYGCTSCTCSKGQWSCISPQCPANCPTNPPAEGSSCGGGGCCAPQPGTVCTYTCSSTNSVARATCVGTGATGTWKNTSCASSSNPGLVTCATTACDLDAGQACCDTRTNGNQVLSCGPVAAGSFCMMGAIETCDEKADCPSGSVCCLEFQAPGIAATCQPSSCATGTPRYQACKTSAECTNGGTCTVYTCQSGETIQACEKPSKC